MSNEKLDNITPYHFKKGYIPLLSEIKLRVFSEEDRLVVSRDEEGATCLAIPVIITNNIELGYKQYPSPKMSKLELRFRALRYCKKGFYVCRETKRDYIYIDMEDILHMNLLNNNIIFKTLGGNDDK